MEITQETFSTYNIMENDDIELDSENQKPWTNLQVRSSTNWSAITAGLGYTGAIKSDGIFGRGEIIGMAN